MKGGGVLRKNSHVLFAVSDHTGQTPIAQWLDYILTSINCTYFLAHFLSNHLMASLLENFYYCQDMHLA
jgi:hypothetical protein